MVLVIVTILTIPVRGCGEETELKMIKMQLYF